MKRIAVIIAAVLAALVCAGFATGFIMTPAQYYRAHPDTSLCENTPRVTLMVVSASVTESSGGVLLSREYALTDGDSVFDILSRALSCEDIPFGYSGNANVYIRSIDGLAEFDLGPASGWLYFVNGEAPDISCARYFPEDGDTIEFRYTIRG